MDRRRVPMGRKGQGDLNPISVLVTVGIVLGLGALLYFFVIRTGSAGNNAFTCAAGAAGSSETCVEQSAGCPTDYERDFFKLFGCPAVAGKSQMCCTLKPLSGSGSTSSPTPLILMQAYKLDIRPAAGGTTPLQISNRDPLRPGATIQVVAGQPFDVMIEGQAQN